MEIVSRKKSCIVLQKLRKAHMQINVLCLNNTLFIKRRILARRSGSRKLVVKMPTNNTGNNLCLAS